MILFDRADKKLSADEPRCPPATLYPLPRLDASPLLSSRGSKLKR